MSYADEHEFYVERQDPDGEVYEDGSRDLLGAGGWPAAYPEDRTKVGFHIAAADIDLSEPELAWLVEDGGPKLLTALRAALGIPNQSKSIQELGQRLFASGACSCTWDANPAEGGPDDIVVASDPDCLAHEILRRLRVADELQEAVREYRRAHVAWMRAVNDHWWDADKYQNAEQAAYSKLMALVEVNGGA